MNPVHALTRLSGLLDEIGGIVDWPDERLYVRVEAVSGWSPAQHVDHVLRALEMTARYVERLEEGEAVDAQRGPTLAGRVILLTGWIPRGRGDAPRMAQPDPRPVRHRLRVALREAMQRRERLLDRAAALQHVPGRIPHHLLGGFDAVEWVRFLQIHTRHHLAIVADIDRHRAAAEHAPSPAQASRARDEPEYGVGAESP